MHKSLILISLAALSGCATNSVYFKDRSEASANKERLRVSAPSIYGATKQDLEWLKLAATSKSEFSGMFIIVLPFLLADIPISSISDSVALLSPITWKNHNGRDRELSRGGPYITYINGTYRSAFDSLQAFEEFFKRVQGNSEKRAFGLTSELWSHGFECEEPCNLYKPRILKRYAEMEGCIQKQMIHMNKEWYSDIEYELSMKSSCQ